MRIASPARYLILATVALATALSIGRSLAEHRSGSSTGERASAARLESVTATVRSIDPQNRTLTLVTGVGYALRIQRVEVPANVTVGGRGGGALSSVTPGCIVRVGCHHAAAGMVASTLELIERPIPASQP